MWHLSGAQPEGTLLPRHLRCGCRGLSREQVDSMDLAPLAFGGLGPTLSWALDLERRPFWEKFSDDISPL